LVWGRYTGEFAAKYAMQNGSDDIPNDMVSGEEKRIYDGIFHGAGEENPYEIRKQLTDVMDERAYVFRTGDDLAYAIKKVKELKERSWKHIDDRAKEYNTNFTNVMELDSMLRTCEVVLAGAYHRLESRGSHARLDYPIRDDENFLKHTLAYHTGDGPKIAYHPVTITKYKPAERHY
jgi:succinate dehydrogenase / fumarate reductase flavoprotein subunit